MLFNSTVITADHAKMPYEAAPPAVRQAQTHVNQPAIPFSAFTGVDMTRVASMVIGLGSATSPKRGAGTIFVDDITVERSAQ